MRTPEATLTSTLTDETAMRNFANNGVGGGYVDSLDPQHPNHRPETNPVAAMNLLVVENVDLRRENSTLRDVIAQYEAKFGFL